MLSLILFNYLDLYNEIINTINEIDKATGLGTNNKKNSIKYTINTPTLNQFGEDLTRKAKERKN